MIYLYICAVVILIITYGEYILTLHWIGVNKKMVPNITNCNCIFNPCIGYFWHMNTNNMTQVTN